MIKAALITEEPAKRIPIFNDFYYCRFVSFDCLFLSAHSPIRIMNNEFNGISNQLINQSSVILLKFEYI